MQTIKLFLIGYLEDSLLNEDLTAEDIAKIARLLAYVKINL